MVNEISVVKMDVSKKPKRPIKGDVFYFKTNKNEYLYGQVVLADLTVGPFKNTLLICIFDKKTMELQGEVSSNGCEFLVPPIITDESCWKNGYFFYLGNESFDEDVLDDFLFVNPLNNRAYDLSGNLYEGSREGKVVGERALCYFENVIKIIECKLNERFMPN
ncbi:Imm26 family immunity protein [Pectobacterium aroidearum]|uniref:Imm26 family immunity protein n=1 Tax=Pectobacterium aroidearum TaxID=1201031 RepID=UPI0032EE7099